MTDSKALEDLKRRVKALEARSMQIGPGSFPVDWQRRSDPCQYCRQDTGYQHELNCPNNPNKGLFTYK